MSQLTTVKRVKNAILMKDDKDGLFIRIDGVRFSYPHIGHPGEARDDSDSKAPKYGVVLMLPKKTHLEAKNLVKEVIQDIIKKNKATVPVAMWCLLDGDEKEDENMKGHWLINTSESRRPKARDARGQIMDDLDKIDETFYGGMWGHALIRPWYFNGKAKSGKTYPKRVPSGIAGVFHWKNDTPFGAGSIDDEDAWGDVPEDDGSDGFGEDAGGSASSAEDDF